MKWTIKHYFPVKQALAVENLASSATSWDALRTGDDDTWQSIPKDRSMWVARCQQKPEIAVNAKAIVDLVKREGFYSIISVGVGAAYLEYNIKKLHPALSLTCSDFTPRSIDRLRDVFLECDSIEVFDMLKDQWQPRQNALYLLYRVDTEFSDEQWKGLFATMSESNINDVLFVPSVFLGWRFFIKEKLVNLWHRLKGYRIMFAGYVRTKDTVKTFWISHYHVIAEVPIGALTGFLLRKN